MEAADKARNLPKRPGVYLFRNAGGEVIYVGKAASLRDRVRSYFGSPSGHSPKTRALVSEIADLEYIVTDSPVEALILESNLIKQYRPKYNISLRDDKNYPYLRVGLEEDFPRVTVVRKVKKDGARYFGPFTNSTAMNQTVKTLRTLFPFRSCRRLENKARACLNYHIKLCPAPCQGYISREDYRQGIGALMDFLEGKTDRVEAALRRQMEEAAENLDFERAAATRDQLKAIKAVVERQKMVSLDLMDRDAVGYAQEEGEAVVQVFFIRGGRLVGRDHFWLPGAGDLSGPEIMTAFVKEYYGTAIFVPPEILLAAAVEEREDLQEWLSARRGGRVHIAVPAVGEKARLIKMASENARLLLLERREERKARDGAALRATSALAGVLGLEEAPRRIECFDISNTGGRLAVASMVVFIDGSARPDLYRRFNLRGVEGPDDYASLQESVYRRFKRGLREREATPGSEGGPDPGFADFPDLLLVDGGKGQLGAVREVLEELGLCGIASAALAKEREELFFGDDLKSLVLPRESEVRRLLQRIRDEAHRFAVTAHRRRRERAAVASLLDDVPGIGPKRKKALFDRYQTIDDIRRAPLEELSSLPLMNRTVAERIKEHLGDYSLRREGDPEGENEI